MKQIKRVFVIHEAWQRDRWMKQDKSECMSTLHHLTEVDASQLWSKSTYLLISGGDIHCPTGHSLPRGHQGFYYMPHSLKKLPLPPLETAAKLLWAHYCKGEGALTMPGLSLSIALSSVLQIVSREPSAQLMLQLVFRVWCMFVCHVSNQSWLELHFLLSFHTAMASAPSSSLCALMIILIVCYL